VKNSYKKSIAAIIILFSVIIISGCEKVEPDSTYSFEIISSGDGFNGYYKVDDQAATEFSSSPMGTSTIYHRFEKNLVSPVSILIDATGSSISTSSISIYIYEKSVCVKSEKFTPSAAGIIVTANILYTFGSSTTTTK